jgi:hypothetical protein
VPGAGRSNLNPPSLAAVALAIAQVGAVLLVRARADRRTAAGTRSRRTGGAGTPTAAGTAAAARGSVIAVVNRAAMGVYLWHQTALIVVTLLAARLSSAPLPGVHTVPDGPAWVAARVMWLPVFGVALWAILRATGTTVAAYRSDVTNESGTPVRHGPPHAPTGNGAVA